MNLRRELLSNIVSSSFGGTRKEFLPRGKLEALVTEQSVRHELGITHLDKEDERLVYFVLAQSKAVFAILLCCEFNMEELKAVLEMFQSNDFGDNQLPIAEWRSDHLKQSGELHAFVHMEGEYNGTRWGRIWKRHRVFMFQDVQFMFFVPVLSTAQPNHDFGELTVPIMSQEARSSLGHYAVLWKSRIHPDHIKLPPEKNVPDRFVFAVKEIRLFAGQHREYFRTRWEQELRTLIKLNSVDHGGHSTKFYTAFRRGDPDDPEHYFILEWADGGNLTDLWHSIPKPILTTSLVRETIQQFHGLAQALRATHFLEDDEGDMSGAYILHGNLKPTNILRFMRKEAVIGHLKIDDWGELKDELDDMRLRGATTTNFGSRRYLPPESDHRLHARIIGDQDERRTRLYDIWSIGCITLEFIVWLFYGLEGLKLFVKHHRDSEKEGSDYWPAEDPPFYQIRKEGDVLTAQTHDIATLWMNHMANDPACQAGHTALGDLLNVVQTCLLVSQLPMIPRSLRFGGSFPGVRMPSPFGAARTSTTKTRIRADELYDRLKQIQNSDKGKSYWSRLPLSTVPKVVLKGTRLLAIPGAVQGYQGSVRDSNSFSSHYWTQRADLKFSREVLSVIIDTKARGMPESHISSNLCSACSKLQIDIWEPSFKQTYSVAGLVESASNSRCDLCILLLRNCCAQVLDGPMFEHVVLQRRGSKLWGGRGPSLSLSQSPGFLLPQLYHIPVGFGELPKSGSDAHLEIVRQWLKHCNCEEVQAAHIPARLIDVGDSDTSMVRLWETKVGDNAIWVALSHHWGDDENKHFSTTRENRPQFISGIPLTSFPATFRDAIKVTRAIGERYLWIDSICIIQGPDGDFKEQAPHMEEVYSGARCVIAASCAKDHFSGFLGERRPRDHVALQHRTAEKGVLYISQEIDDFRGHVLDGHLNSRGWVFQEHALGKRTISFTEYQTYWECGHGVRCETMTTLSCESARLLADPQFPKLLINEPPEIQIRKIEELYQSYSRLGLSRAWDRPMAINGLQARLLRTLGLAGCYGVLQGTKLGKTKGFLGRSLLWTCGEEIPSLVGIEFPEESTQAPTWSWMAYRDPGSNANAGGISFLSPELDQVDWEKLELSGLGYGLSTSNQILRGKAVRFERPNSEGKLKLENSSDGSYEGICMVVCAEKNPRPYKRICWVIVLENTTGSSEDDFEDQYFKRIGAGWLPFVCLKGRSFKVKVY